MNVAPAKEGRKYQRIDGLLTASVKEEMLMMSVELGAYFNLNPVGSRIWELLASARTLDELVDELTAEYEVSAQTARAEVAGFLAQLDREGLLRS